MLIVCPSCASQYELDAAKLGPDGRKVRCAGCKTSWHVAPEPAFPEAPSGEETQALLNEELAQAAIIDAQVTALAAERDEPSEAEPEKAAIAPVAPPRRSRAGRRKGNARGKAAGAGRGSLSVPIALTLAGLAFVGLLVWQRDLAVRGAPQLAMLFETIGLPVNVRGLSLSAVESGLVEDGQGRFLVVEGDVTNISKGNTAVPPIEVSVRDAGGQTLYTWTTEPPRPNLEPSELVRFRARLASPPANGQSVLVRFNSTKSADLASIR